MRTRLRDAITNTLDLDKLRLEPTVAYAGAGVFASVIEGRAKQRRFASISFADNTTYDPTVRVTLVKFRQQTLLFPESARHRVTGSP